LSVQIYAVLHERRHPVVGREIDHERSTTADCRNDAHTAVLAACGLTFAMSAQVGTHQSTQEYNYEGDRCLCIDFSHRAVSRVKQHERNDARRARNVGALIERYSRQKKSLLVDLAVRSRIMTTSDPSESSHGRRGPPRTFHSRAVPCSPVAASIAHRIIGTRFISVDRTPRT
jgi:hypothetical protein